jgi:spore coat protein CotF
VSFNSQHGQEVKEADERAVEISIKKPKIKAASSKKHNLKPIFQNKSTVVVAKSNENDLIFQNQELMNISKIDEMPSLTSSTSFLFGLDKKFTMTSNNTPDFECSAIEKLEVGE